MVRTAFDGISLKLEVTGPTTLVCHAFVTRLAQSNYPIDWSLDQLEVTHDRDLRGLGNLYRRLHAASLCDDIRSALPSLSSPDPLEQELVDSLMSIPGEVTEAMKSLSISRAIEAIVARLDLVSAFLLALGVGLTPGG